MDRDVARNVLIVLTNVKHLVIREKNVPRSYVKLKCVCSANAATDGSRLFVNLFLTDPRLNVMRVAGKSKEMTRLQMPLVMHKTSTQTKTP